jgi:hypothetical protein
MKGDDAGIRTHARGPIWVDAVEYPGAILPANPLSHQRQVGPQGIHDDSGTVPEEEGDPALDVSQQGSQHVGPIERLAAVALGP